MFEHLSNQEVSNLIPRSAPYHRGQRGPEEAVLRLQRLAGNKAVAGMLSDSGKSVFAEQRLVVQRCEEKDRINLPPSTPLEPFDAIQETKTHRDLPGTRRFMEFCHVKKDGKEECRKRWVVDHEVVCSYRTPSGDVVRGRRINSYSPGLTSADLYQVCPGISGFTRRLEGANPAFPGSGTQVKYPVWGPNPTASDFNGGTFKPSDEKKESDKPW